MADCRKEEKYGKGLLVNSAEAFEEQGDGEEQRDDGPLFMVRRVCFTLRKAEDGDEQCHNLFHSRCTIRGKICQLVINLGSCENVLAEEVVKKLALETEQHSNPYHL